MKLINIEAMNHSTHFVSHVRENMTRLSLLAAVSAILIMGYIVFVPRTIINNVAIVMCIGIFWYAGKALVSKMVCLLDDVIVPKQSLLVSKKRREPILDTKQAEYQLFSGEVAILEKSCGNILVVHYGEVVWKYDKPLIDSKAIAPGSSFLPHDYLEQSILIEFDSSKEEASQRAEKMKASFQMSDQNKVLDLGYQWIDCVVKEFDRLNAGAGLEIDEYFLRLKSFIKYQFDADFGKKPKVTTSYKVM
ncbi:MAG: hypothetical protein KBC22_00420 [Candidatus Pacebacteria bacterium]|nr:hypothetical protein [Candidatus Paceibacterota bacterium]